uniref:Peptidase S1 domain-containing protein n=1 Tax=Odontella aurita TaxID=265563 RepID=A0A7S4JFR0_9STRA
MMCAVAPEGETKDACLGDSGGPILLNGGEDDDTGAETDVQAGIVSFGVGCANPDFPGIYARVSDQIEWIDEVVCSRSIGDPPTDFGCSIGADEDNDGDGLPDEEDQCPNEVGTGPLANSHGCPDGDEDGVPDKDDQCPDTPPFTPRSGVGLDGCFLITLTNRPTMEPTSESSRSPTHFPTPGPTRDPTAKLTPGPTPFPSTRPAPEPTTGPTPSSTTPPTPGPTKNPTPEPTPDPTSEPTPPFPSLSPTPGPVLRPPKWGEPTSTSPTLPPVAPAPTLSPTALRPTLSPITPAPQSKAPTIRPTSAPTAAQKGADIEDIFTPSPTAQPSNTVLNDDADENVGDKNSASPAEVSNDEEAAPSDDEGEEKDRGGNPAAARSGEVNRSASWPAVACAALAVALLSAF